MNTMKFVLATCIILALRIVVVRAAPWINAATLRHVENYLRKYGYAVENLNPPNGNSFSAALSRFQKEIGLVKTGQLDVQTISMMKRPRCGNLAKAIQNRPRRFVPYKMRWSNKTLKWKLDDPYNLLGKHERFIARSTLHRAFGDWSIASKKALIFVEERDKGINVNFNIYFARGDHNDSLPFDGKAGIVAHGFYPTRGDLHFDADENWTLHTVDGINLYQTAMHEIGHLLGLEHSNDNESVMFPINRPYDPMFKLGDDDIRGIRYLYAPWAWTSYINWYLQKWWKSSAEK